MSSSGPTQRNAQKGMASSNRRTSLDTRFTICRQQGRPHDRHQHPRGRAIGEASQSGRARLTTLCVKRPQAGSAVLATRGVTHRKVLQAVMQGAMQQIKGVCMPMAGHAGRVTLPALMSAMELLFRRSALAKTAAMACCRIAKPMRIPCLRTKAVDVTPLGMKTSLRMFCAISTCANDMQVPDLYSVYQQLISAFLCNTGCPEA